MMSGNNAPGVVQGAIDIMKTPLAVRDGKAMDRNMEKERLTEDLLARLLESDAPEDFLEQDGLIDRTLPEYLFQLLARTGIKRNRLALNACLNPTFVYDIFEGKCRPKRNNALMLAFGLHCTLRETQRLLRLADVSELWPKVRRDAIIIWCIGRGYTREQCDDELYRLGEETIFKCTGELA